MGIHWCHRQESCSECCRVAQSNRSLCSFCNLCGCPRGAARLPLWEPERSSVATTLRKAWLRNHCYDGLRPEQTLALWSGRGTAVCLWGGPGAVNVSSAVRRHLLGALAAELFVVAIDGKGAEALRPWVELVNISEDAHPELNLGFSPLSWNWSEASDVASHWMGRNKTSWLQIAALQACKQMIEAEEAKRGQNYSSVILSRMDNMWLNPHPAIDHSRGGCWIPWSRGQEDHDGVATHYALCDRAAAQSYMSGRLRNIVDPTCQKGLLSWFMKCKNSLSNPETLSDEVHLRYSLASAGVSMHRFEGGPCPSCSSKEISGCVFVPQLGLSVRANMLQLAMDELERWQYMQRVMGNLPAAGAHHTRAVNVLEGRSYSHHPVMLTLTGELFAISPEYVVEWNGLRVPVHLDCARNPKAHWSRWGCLNYFFAVPTRWTACYLHDAYVKSAIPFFQPQLPLIDEEYSEHVAVYQSVLRARRSFIMAELGARWGTWGARAVAMLRMLNPMPYQVLFVESESNNCRELERVMSENLISYSLDCGLASSSNLTAWITRQDHVDLLDLDIQGSEVELLGNRDLLSAISKKVYRLIIGTHSPEIHEKLQSMFREWLVIYDLPYAPDVQCLREHLRAAHGESGMDRRGYDRILERGCYNIGPWGKVANWDGELIIDNPSFIDLERHFSMNDVELRVDDLLARS